MFNIRLSGFADEIDKSFDRQMEVIPALGMEYIEIRGVDSKNVADLTDEEVAEVKAKLDAAGVKISSIGSPIGKIDITDDFDAHMEKFRRVAATAKALGTRYIRMFSFFMPKDSDPADYREEVLCRLKAMIAVAEEMDLVLLHENEKDIYGDTAVRCADLMKELYGDHFKGVFDFANFIQCGVDPVEAYDLMRPYIEYIHIKDALKADGSVVPPGMGDGHLPELLGKFKESGYEGFLSLEPHLTNFTGLAGLEKDVQERKTALTGEEAFKLAHDSLVDIIKAL